MSLVPSFYPFIDAPPTIPGHPPSSLNRVVTATRRSLSRISNMTVGDVRHCFSQIRSTVPLMTSTVLWCGLTAGEFALQYLVHTVGISRKKRRGRTIKAGADPRDETD